MDELIAGYNMIEQGYETMTEAASKLDKSMLTEKGLQLAFTLLQFRKELMYMIRRYDIIVEDDFSDEILEAMDSVIDKINDSTAKIQQLGG